MTSLLPVLAFAPCLAADKSGVGPNTISLPKGPGAIEGLGESFQPHLNTGTASSGVTVKLPPGTAGHAPSLALGYEGGSGNGPVGFGWSLPMPCVQRRSDHGIPTYGENVGFDRSDAFITDSREELVPLTNGFLFCKNEGAFIRYRFLTNYWEGISPNGVVMQYGLTADAQILDPANTNHVFSWLLQRQTDTHGNTIVYSYTNFPGANNLNQKYLSGIAYGPGAPPWNNFHFVTFIYEDRPDWFEDCRAGFVVRTGKRLKQIIVGTQGPALTNHLAGDFNGDGQTDCLDREYVLDYLNYAGTNSYWSLLSQVTVIGADGTSSLPPATFGYNVCNPPDTLSAAGSIIGGLNEPPQVMDNTSVDFLDLNGDGLPDVLATNPGDGTHTAYLNQGQSSSGGSPVINWKSGVQVDSADGQAVQFDLQSTVTIAHLADMDGDGLSDLVVTAGDGGVSYFRNQGSIGWGPRQNMSIQDSAPPSPFSSPDVRTADMDFDKRMDVIQSISTGDGADYRIWFNLGNQTYSSAITVPQSAGMMFSTPGVQIADFNGDRVPDIARITPSYVTVTAGLGYGTFADPITVAIPDLTLDDTQLSHATLMDINGDGLADLVVERAVPGELWYWINQGNYTFSHRKVITGMPTGVGANAVIRWADINGNGTTDLIYADSTSSPRMQAVDVGQLLNNGATPNLLISTANGIGLVSTISYQSSTVYSLADATAGKPWPDLMPNPVQVVAAITNSDSLRHAYVSLFSYHNGYYDPVEKQFRGFAAAEQTDIGDVTAPTLVTRSFFDTGRTYESMKGKLLSLSMEQADGGVFSVTTNLWIQPPVVLYTGTNTTNVSFAHPTGSVRVITELGQGTPRQLETEVTYDNYGNQTTNIDYGIVVNGDRTASNDERVVTTQYALNTNLWLLRHPARTQIQDFNGNVISRVESYYDDETFSGNNFGVVTVGNSTLNRAWINPADANAYIKASRAKYDGYGNPITLLDPLAPASDFSQGHAREIGYDTRFQSYPTTETIHVGNGSQDLVFQAGYDAGFGTVLSSTDFNGNQTAYSHDPFARLSSIIKPYDTATYPTVEYDYAMAVPTGSNGLVNYVETRQFDTAPQSSGDHRSHYFISRQFTDGLGRPLMTKTEAEPAPGSSSPRVVISQAVQFNARQKPAVALNPCFSLNGGATLDDLFAFENIEAPGWQGSFQLYSNLVPLNFPSAHKITSTYDATLRVTTATNQDGTFNRNVFEPLLVRSFDENQTDPASPFHQNCTVHYADGLGRMIQKDEITRLNDDGTPAGTFNTWTTRFDYDLNDEPIRVTDSQGNVITRQYDGLKRRTLAHDLDRGDMLYGYDDAANLQQTTDARGQQTLFAYDGVNRLLSETYVGSTLSPRLGEDRGEGPVNVAFHYDTPAGLVDNGDGTRAVAANTKGRLAFVSDGSGEEHRSYDARGRVQYLVKRIPDSGFISRFTNPASLVAFRTSFDYDSLDRVTVITFPDNDEVGYQYNPRNLLGGILGGPGGEILSNLVYCPSGQRQQISCGNGVRTIYGYDTRQRLSSLLTLPSGASGNNNELLDFRYEFDGVSNIKSITDVRPGPSLPSQNPRRNSQAFTYDDLYRLGHAGYVFAVPPSPLPAGWVAAQAQAGHIDYRYDRIGNLLSQTSDILQFEQGFSITQLGQLSYGGGAGSSGRNGRTANDPPGPHALTSVSQPSTNSPQPRQYSYDANGNMLNLDGLTNTWDFKDRLVASENTEMRADYLYDYTDRRILKSVRAKPNSPTGTPGEGRIGDSFSTTYVSSTFEIRDHDAPTKYVFDGATRVARVTGSLSSNPRIQRLRVSPGWNLCSCAVTASDTLDQLSASAPMLIRGAFKWSASASNWLAVLPGETLPAGTVLWLNASTNAVLPLSGAYLDPFPMTLLPGSAFLPGCGLEAWPLTNALPSDSVAWFFPAPTNLWQAQFNNPLGSQSDLPSVLAPGQALFIQAHTGVQIAPPAPALRIRYYHCDHLGSSSAITDENGALVEESAFYPFGAKRSEYQPGLITEPYQFTQKENDRESGLEYFGKRYCHPALGRWLSTDPKEEKGGGLNLYAYVNQNPLKYQDPDGANIDVKETKVGKNEHYEITLTGVVVSDAKQTTITTDQLNAYAAKLAAEIQNDYQGKEGHVTWHTTVKLTVVSTVPPASSTDHVFKIVDVCQRGQSARGDAWKGSRVMEISVGTFLAVPPGASASEAERKEYQSAETVGAHEFGHTAGPNDRFGDQKNLMSEDRLNDSHAIDVGQLYQMVDEARLHHVNLTEAEAAKLGPASK